MSGRGGNDHGCFFQEAGRQGAEVELARRAQSSLLPGLDTLRQVDQLMEKASPKKYGEGWSQRLHCVISEVIKDGGGRISSGIETGRRQEYSLCFTWMVLRTECFCLPKTCMLNP